ncbi:unnamed protein product [Caenorhabditis sp. 36 PRJEB53466]|nr:unnamed protein product [Caenorhabditis sp. 36 PRJEB53466]
MTDPRLDFNDSPLLDTPSGGFLEQTFLNPRNNDRSRRSLASTEPDFANPAGACHMVYWQDCIAQLAVEIREKQNVANACDFEFLKPEIVEYLFTVCVRLRLPSEVRFTAALILNLYLLRQICSLHEFVEKKEMPALLKQREWENLETNMERQLPLRILTAIQISSKIHSYHDSISSRQVVNTLRKIGYPYTISAVELSEQRIFKFIGFRIPDSPFEACEMTMKVLTFTMNRRGIIEEEKYEDLWQHVLIVLDICFINHAEIYESFLRKCPYLLESDCEKRLILSKFKWDVLLLASAAVQTAVTLSIGNEHIRIISEVINRLLRCDPDFVDALRLSILELAKEKKEEEYSEVDI